MLAWLIALVAGALVAGVQYGRSARSPRVTPLALLRGASAALLLALLLSAPAGRARHERPDVALDASASWLRATDSSAWRAALDSAAAVGGTLRRFGDSLRTDARRTPPVDATTTFRAVVDASGGSGTPVVVITDGESDEPELLSALPSGSRAVVIAKREQPDLAVSALDAPRALLAGDTVSARITLTAGAAGSGAARLALRLDDATLDTSAVPALAPFSERVVVLRGVAGGAERGAVLRAVVRAAGDREPRNDTLSLGVDVTRAPAAVFVSTAPDFDAREAVAALRGVTSLPTRAYYRVAPGMWRTDGTLARVDERAVRDAVREAPMAVLHGDTALFGPPRTATRAALLLFAPSASDDGEWFAAAAPASPLSSALSALPFDSLPPLSVAAQLPKGDWQALVTHRGGAPDDRRPAIVGWDAPRRIAVIGATGFWRWRFRGGVRADAYAALFGALYDWLAAGRSDRRAAVPDAAVQRAGESIRWRRGAPSDTSTMIVLAARGSTRRDTLHLAFAEGAAAAESPALAPGIYDVTTTGGASVLAVNASRELLPHRVTLHAGAVGSEPSAGAAPLLRDRGWAYLLVVLLLCAEWLMRRRAGLR